MPESEPGAKPAKAARGSDGRSIIRSVVLYLVVGATAAGISGLYLFRYVPSKLQYFLGMRFRTLSVAAGQLKSKAESLSQALASAKKNVDPDKQADYLRILIPDLKGTAGIAGFVLDDHYIAWDDLVAQASEATQANFDDLIIAKGDGDVVWQRERTSPRIGNLARLLDSKFAADGWSLFSLQWNIQTTSFSLEDKKRVMPDTATSTLVNLDGGPSVLLTQPVELQIDTTGGKKSYQFFLGGFVSRSALQNEAMHVPTEWVVYALVPFALVFLSLPFIKLATVTPKERYSFGDMVALVLCTVLVAAIGGALPFLSDSPADQSDESLRSFAAALDHNIWTEAKHFVALTQTIQDGKVGPLAPCKKAIKDLELSVCDFWQAMPEGQQTPFAALDVISWANNEGMQTRKWTAKSQITPRISLGDYHHFRDIQSRRTWSLKGRSEQFTIEPLRSPTTSEMAFVFAMPNTASSHPPPSDPRIPTADEAPVIAINVKPQSLVDPLVPPGFGFAVLAADGRVLFHSTAALSLEENFLHELSDVGPIAQAMSIGGDASWTGDYHGRRHRFYSTRVSTLDHCPWRLVTFREIEPLLDFSAARQSSALLLFIGYALAMQTLVAGYLLYHRMSGRSVKDVVIATLIPTRDSKVTWASILTLSLLGLGLFAIVISTDFVSPQQFSYLYLALVAVPVVAVILVGTHRRHPAPGRMPTYRRHDYFNQAIAVFLVALVLGALPAAGMTRLAHRMDDIRQNLVWLTVSRDRSIERERTVRGFVNRTESYSSESNTKKSHTSTKEMILSTGFARPRIDTTSPLLYSYQSQLLRIHLKDEEFEDNTHAPSKRSYDSYGSPWVEKGLDWLRGLFSESAFVLPHIEIANDLKSIRLADAEKDDLHYTADLPAGFFGDLRAMPTISGLAILAATFFLIYWARHALSSHGTADAMSIEDAIRRVEAGGPNPAILVIGPARNEKDRIAAQAVEKVTWREPELNIRLLDVIITEDWVDDQIAAADRLKDPDDATGWLWIQVSNLETQLVDRNSRAEVFRLLEKLSERRLIDGVLQRPAGLIVTTTIDPTAHFSEVFLEERQEIYANAIPEVELNRTSVLLSRFRRCYVTNEGLNPWDRWYHYEPAHWQDTLEDETSNHRLLSAVRVDLQRAWALRAQVPKDELRRAIRVRAEACYQLLWTSCTRSEKLVLIQLAQEGVINPKCSDTVDELIAKGLIWPGAAPTIFNMTFRDFLRDIERADVVQQWEHMEGSGLWVVSGRLVAIALMVGGLFYLVTQGISVQSVLPIISGSGLLGAPLLRSVAGLFSPKKDTAALS
jgi:hypothetical protein